MQRILDVRVSAAGAALSTRPGRSQDVPHRQTIPRSPAGLRDRGARRAGTKGVTAPARNSRATPFTAIPRHPGSPAIPTRFGSFSAGRCALAPGRCRARPKPLGTGALSQTRRHHRVSRARRSEWRRRTTRGSGRVGDIRPAWRAQSEMRIEQIAGLMRSGEQCRKARDRGHRQRRACREQRHRDQRFRARDRPSPALHRAPQFRPRIRTRTRAIMPPSSCSRM